MIFGRYLDTLSKVIFVCFDAKVGIPLLRETGKNLASRFLGVKEAGLEELDVCVLEVLLEPMPFVNKLGSFSGVLRSHAIVNSYLPLCLRRLSLSKMTAFSYLAQSRKFFR